MSVRDQFMLDIFTTALEGGIGYWSECQEYHWCFNGEQVEPDLHGFYAKIVEIVGDENKPHTINRQTIAHGYSLATTTPWQYRVRWSSERPPLVLDDEDAWDFDAGDADVIVQLGLFGDVVYG